MARNEADLVASTDRSRLQTPLLGLFRCGSDLPAGKGRWRGVGVAGVVASETGHGLACAFSLVVAERGPGPRRYRVGAAAGVGSYRVPAPKGGTEGESVGFPLGPVAERINEVSLCPKVAYRCLGCLKGLADLPPGLL